jgi:ribonuclease D
MQRADIGIVVGCDLFQVASKVIATVDDLEQIAADDNADVGALHGWRRELFGEAALALKQGRMALAIEKGKVVKVERN